MTVEEAIGIIADQLDRIDRHDVIDYDDAWKILKTAALAQQTNDKQSATITLPGVEKDFVPR